MSAGLHISSQLDLPHDAVTETFALLAKRGAGKSNAAVVMAERMYDAGLPWVAVDPKGDWWGVQSSKDGSGEGLSVPVLGGEHGDIPLEPTGGRVIANLIARERLTAVIDVSLMSKADARRFLADFAEELYRTNREPLHVFAEEAHEYIPQRVDAGAARMVGAWEKLVKWGRTHGIGVTLITQRSASLNKDVLTQVETLVALRTTGPQDVAAIKAWVDEHESGREVLAELRKLPSGDAYVLSPQWLELDQPKRITFDRRRTFDSGATPKAGQKRVTPRTVAEVDLAALKEAMAETIEKAKADDPKHLRQEIARLRRELDAERNKPAPEVEVREVKIAAIDDDVMERLVATVASLGEIGGALETALASVRAVPSAPAPRVRPAPVQRPMAAVRREPVEVDGDVNLRAGARRMVESLGRMAPLRLTKAQWGTVSKMKTTSGTWSTYLGDIRRLGYIDENGAGFTLTDAGFDYLGGRPDPMTPEELQAHYRSILRAGAVRMLDAIMDAYPRGLTRDELGAAADIATTSGTFSTYVGDLTRNGLAERRDGEIVATDILMLGAGAA